jgi:hypothetical protein
MNALLMNQSNPNATPSPTPKPTPSPEPTYLPGEKNYSSYGNVYVTGVEIYGGGIEGNQIKWGSLYIGDSTDVSFFVRSTSNVPIVLSLSVTDWAPSGISSFLHLYWNYNQTIINPHEETFLTITLTTPNSPEFANYLINNNVNSFNFNIHIYSIKF